MYELPTDRATRWKPGVTYNGGLPDRNTVCATIDAAAHGNGTKDATAAIQSAIDKCPRGQVVQLSAGTFRIDSGNIIMLNKGITLRGAGAGSTILQKTDGAKVNRYQPGPRPSPVIIVGPGRWRAGGDVSTDLTIDAAKGGTAITVADATGFRPGQIVLLDELSGAQWMPDPAGRGQIWASPDWRVVWQLHKPSQPTDDPLRLPAAAANQDAFGWFSRTDRPTAEIKEIASVDRNTITFSSPIHISYRVARNAQITRYAYSHVKNAGLEQLTVRGGDDGNIRFEWAAYSWARNVESTAWLGEGIAVGNSFRVEVRDSYIHDAVWAQPGGGGYAISLSGGSAEVLFENTISMKANKIVVARSAGAGSVFGYNYFDDGYISGNPTWVEVGLNASHMVGPHHVLFEGNYSFNWDSDKTHGNSIYHTVFRNHLSGTRRPFVNPLDNTTIADGIASGSGPLRCAGAGYYSYWMSFVGNVLGEQGRMTGWDYENTQGLRGRPAIWMLGWDDLAPYPVDPDVVSTAVRDGNFDWVTGTQRWQTTPAPLPNSLYMPGKPAFFGANTWPWVDPSTGTTYTLPAKARFDNGTPNTLP